MGHWGRHLASILAGPDYCRYSTGTRKIIVCCNIANKGSCVRNPVQQYQLLVKTLFTTTVQANPTSWEPRWYGQNVALEVNGTRPFLHISN